MNKTHYIYNYSRPKRKGKKKNNCTNILHTFGARTSTDDGIDVKAVQVTKQYTGDKGKEATEVTLKAHTRQNMAGNRDGAAATMTHIKQTHHL